LEGLRVTTTLLALFENKKYIFILNVYFA